MSTPKRIVLTGVSRGLGRALIDGFVSAGHIVAGCARSPEAITELQQLHESPHRFACVDVTDDVAVGDWAADVLTAGTVPDLLINNAGVINRNANLWEVPAEEVSRVVDINITGVINVVRHFVPAMIDRGSGVVVNISSGWGRSVAAEVAPYCATKWAVEGLTRALAEELPPGLAAIPLNPGVIHTAMLDSCFGSAACAYPSPGQWANQAVPMLLRLGAADNGQPLTV